VNTSALLQGRVTTTVKQIPVIIPPPEPTKVVILPPQLSARVHTSMLLHERVSTIIKPNPVIIPPLKPPEVVVLPLSQLSATDHDCEDVDHSDLIPPMNPPPKPPDWIDTETSSPFLLRWSERFLEKQRGQWNWV
ncbi:hypothetical protein A2U01_0039624, partial [Trifolium medium]|nr:hypothetical protein [Trifolium medium]